MVWFQITTKCIFFSNFTNHVCVCVCSLSLKLLHTRNHLCFLINYKQYMQYSIRVI